MRNIFDRSGGRTPIMFLLAAILAVPGLACHDALEVELPGRIPTDLLNDPTTAPTLAASVTADFECAFANYVVVTSMIGDDFLGASGNLNAKNWGTKKIYEDDTANEQNTCNDNQGFGAYTPLQTARFQSDDVLKRLSEWTDDQAKTSLAPLRAKVAVLGGFTYTLLGEGFCAMRLDKETSIKTPAEVLAIAKTKFDAALPLVNDMADGAAKTELLNLLYVGRARTLLDLGDKAGAAADAALVAPGFEFDVTRSVDATTRFNKPFYRMTEQGHSSVDPAYRALTVNGVPDPRVQVSYGPDKGFPPKAFDGVTDLYVVTNKNFSRADPMRLASYIEAQLIEAEALGGTQAVAIINARRDQLSLPDYVGPTDDASVTALILDERNREFFMEGGQRYNDLLRYQIPWKVGNDQNGVPYGTTTCMPLPLSVKIAAGG
ncbi:MAG TPA: RagB/SusD family nutrient uptake outer membrane protein [Gemmatimonadaceae bacterium]|nr:RagB/SusD family nutrient uptake outer membrane protein [Gemmatimonadaceae bacterium]